MRKLLYILMLLPMFVQGQAVVNWKKAAYTGSMKFGAGLLGYANATLAQQDSNSFAESCAWLELGNDTTNRGFLLPRVLHRDSVASPKKGLLIYEIVSDLVLVRTASSWDTLSGGSGGGASVTDSMIFATRYWVNSQGFLTSETDPIFTASDAFGVTNSLISNWNAAYNDKINSLAFTGTGTKTLTLTQQDGGMVTNTFTDLGADTTIWATQSDITGLQPYSDTGTTDATRYWVGQQGYTTPQTFNQTLSLDSVGLHQLGISNPNASIAAHFQGNNTNYRMAINTSSNGAGLQGYNNALNAVRMITIQGGGGNVRIGTGVDNGTGIQLARQVRMDSLTTGVVTDSFIVANGGILKRVSSALFATQSALNDTAAVFRTLIGSGGYVPYTGATTNVDLGSNNLTTLGMLTGAIFRFTNPTSYSDVTSSATVPRSNTLPDRAGEIVVPAGTATNGYVIQSNSGVPTWTAPTSSLGGNTERTYISAQINGKNTGTTTIFTTEASKGRFVITRINYWMVTSAGGTVNGSYNLGWTPATYGDIQSAATLVRSTVTNQQGNPVINNTVTIPANTAVVLNITVGVTATTFDLYFEVTGHYQIN